MHILRSLQYSIAIAAVAVSGFNGIRISAHATLSDAVLVVLFCTWMLLFPLTRHAKVAWSVVISAAIFCLAFIACFVFRTSDSGALADLEGFARLFVTFFVLPYLLLDIARTDQQIRTIIGAYVASALVNVAVSVFDALGLTDFEGRLVIETVHGWSYDTRFHGLTMHPNHFGQMCAIASVMVLGLFPSKPVIWRRGVWVASQVALILGVLASGSRAALLAVIVVGLSLLAKYGSRAVMSLSWWVLLPVVTALSGAALLYISELIVIHGAFARLTGAVSDIQQSNAGRLAGYVAALRDFAVSPIVGKGFSHLGQVENLVLQFAQAAGVLGLVGLAFYFYPAASAWRTLRKGVSDPLLLAATSSVAAYLVFTQMVNLTYARFSLIPMGLLWALQRRSRHAQVYRATYPLGQVVSYPKP